MNTKLEKIVDILMDRKPCECQEEAPFDLNDIKPTMSAEQEVEAREAIVQAADARGGITIPMDEQRVRTHLNAIRIAGEPAVSDSTVSSVTENLEDKSA